MLAKLWLLQLLCGLKIYFTNYKLMHKLKINKTIPKNTIVIYADNQRAIKLIDNPIFQKCFNIILKTLFS